MDTFLEFAAGVFGDDVRNINLDLRRGEYEKWDSMMHLTLLMETEEAYGIEVPFDKIAEIVTLRDLYNLVEGK